MVLAHVGHWAVQLVFFVPVVGFIAWLAVTQYRDRRARRTGAVADGGRPSEGEEIDDR